jgi:hypothetical protein
MNLWLEANVLKDTSTSRSTVEVALGTAPALTCEEAVRLVAADGRSAAASLVSGAFWFETASALLSAVFASPAPPLGFDSTGFSGAGVAGLSGVA